MRPRDQGFDAHYDPNMNTTAELTYLAELGNLCDLMLLHAERIEEAAAEWHEHEAAARQGAHRSITGREQSDVRLVTEGVQEMMQRQARIWIALDGFLASWARASLFLWPAPARYRTDAQQQRSRDRGDYLRSILEINETHALNNRELRNDWMHYDERLDDALARYGRVTPQRFLRGAEPSANSAGITMRLFELTNPSLVFANERRHDLRVLFDAVRDVKERVRKALETMAVRRREELLADEE